MRCREIQESLLAGEIDTGVDEHLRGCASCRTFGHELELLRGGFRALAAEPAPDPSWGFASRVVRRLQEHPAGEEFLERIGRRVVYAASLLAIVLLMALALPSSGPFRGPTSAEIAAARMDQGETGGVIFAYESADNQDLNPLPVDQNGAMNGP